MSKPVEKQVQGSHQEIDMPAEAKADKPPPREKRMTKRLVSLDAYRGMIMICLISVGFGLSAFEGHPYLGFLSTQVEHVRWQGMVFWTI